MSTPTCGQVNRVILFDGVVFVFVVVFGMKFTETMVRYESTGVWKLIQRSVSERFK